MTTLTRNEAARWLMERDRFCILTHRRPDGDTAGSAAALCRILRSLGKTAHVLRNPDMTDRFGYLLAEMTKEAVEAGDVIVSVDVAAPNMLPKDYDLERHPVQLRIDHHGSATGFTDFELVDPRAGACAEIIYDILVELGAAMDAATAEALYVATSTDTGCFRFSNTTDHTFLVAAACAGAGARIYELNQKLFETNSFSRLRMQGWMVEHTKLFCGGKMAICAIPKAVEEELGATEDDMDNISSHIRTIAGVCIAATLRETRDGTVKISVRAVPGYDAAAVCEHFHGGGHKGAAGGSSSLSLEQTAQKLEEVMLGL